MSKKTKVVIILTTITVIVLVLGGWWFWQRQSVKLTTFTNNIGASFNYPQKLQVQPLSTQDNKDKFLFRAAEPQGAPPLLTTLRYEDGLKIVVNLTKQELINILVNNTKLAHPQRFPGYKELSQRQFDVKGHKAAEFMFTYTNKGETIKQKFWIIVKDDDTAFYLALQAKQGDFDKVAKKYFDPITNSLAVTP